MAIRPNGTALRQFRTLFHLGTIGPQTDGQLLERFSTGHAQAAELAFAAIVDRHGPMVLRVCRAVLRNEHDAQDAFQATFLVLVRKARSLWVRDSLGPWLHAVALRAARSARANREHRRSREHEINGLELAISSEGSQPDDISEEIHAALDRLPERDRVLLVLCDLQGLTQLQAARHLGCPVGTVKSRLSRARHRLRDQLARRGLSETGVGIGPILVSASVRTTVPAALARSTIGIAMRCVTGRSAEVLIPAAVAILANGVSSAMIFTSLTKLTVPLLALAVAVGVAVDAIGAALRPASAAESRRSGDVPNDGIPLLEVMPGNQPISVLVRGSLEASQYAQVRSPVEGRTTIVSILPDGTRVAKDQLICVLDSEPIRDRLAAQELTVETSGRFRSRGEDPGIGRDHQTRVLE